MKAPLRLPHSLLHGLVYHLRTVSDDYSSDAYTAVVIILVPNTKTNLKYQKQKHSNKAGDTPLLDTTQPASGQHPNWVPNATTVNRGLRALLPNLSCTFCCMFDGVVHTGIIASIAPKGTQKEIGRDKQRE